MPPLDRFRLMDGPLEPNPSTVLNGWQRVPLAWIRAAEAQLAAIDNDFANAETNLRRAIALVQDCETDSPWVP